MELIYCSWAPEKTDTHAVNIKQKNISLVNADF